MGGQLKEEIIARVMGVFTTTVALVQVFGGYILVPIGAFMVWKRLIRKPV